MGKTYDWSETTYKTYKRVGDCMFTCPSDPCVTEMFTDVYQVRNVRQRYPEFRDKPDPLTATSQPRVYQSLRTYGYRWRPILKWCSIYGKWNVQRQYFLQYPGAGWSVRDLCEWSDTWFHAKLLSQIQSLKANLGRTLAQFDKCVALISQFADICLNISNLWRLNYRRWRDLYQSWLDITDMVLWYDFGVKPLVATVADLGDKLAHPPQRKGRIHISKSLEDSFVTDEGIWTEKVKLKVAGTVTIRHTDQVWNYGHVWDWAWERIPFSFVIDWILPVGDWLSAFATLQDVTDLSLTHSVKRTQSFKQTRVDPGWNLVYPYRMTYQSHERSVVGDFNPTVFTLRESRPPKGLVTLANAIALITKLRYERSIRV